MFQKAIGAVVNAFTGNDEQKQKDSSREPQTQRSNNGGDIARKRKQRELELEGAKPQGQAERPLAKKSKSDEQQLPAFTKEREQMQTVLQRRCSRSQSVAGG